MEKIFDLDGVDVLYWYMLSTNEGLLLHNFIEQIFNRLPVYFRLP